MSKETGIDLVATNDVHYTYASDADSHDILPVSYTHLKSGHPFDSIPLTYRLVLCTLEAGKCFSAFKKQDVWF